MLSLWKRVHAQSKTMQRGAQVWRRAKHAAISKSHPVWALVSRAKQLAAPSDSR